MEDENEPNVIHRNDQTAHGGRVTAGSAADTTSRLHMNANSRPTALPWMAAAVAAAVTIVVFLYALHVVSALSSRSDDDRLTFMWSSFISSLVLHAGLAFLIAQWHGERHGQLAFRRRAPLLAIYALFLLAWQAVEVFAVRALVRRLTIGALGAVGEFDNDGTYQGLVLRLSGFVIPVLYILVAWLAWWLATRLLRKDALPGTSSVNVRLRVAGLAAWTLAVLLLFQMPQGVALLQERFDDNPALAVMSGYVGITVILVALAFAGALRGLPRNLGQLHGWRLLGASFAAMITAVALTLSALGSLQLTGSLMAGLLIVILTSGIGAAYWLWVRVFYAGVVNVPVTS